MSDLQASILQEKGRKDELEELKRQQLEDKQLDEKCKLIDERARTAQQCQENAHKEREKIVRQVEMNRRIRTKEQELESAQLVTSFIFLKRKEELVVLQPHLFMEMEQRLLFTICLHPGYSLLHPKT